MNRSSRFVVAVQVLTGIAMGEKLGKQQCITSALLADSVNTNPVVIRRILGSLRKAGLVHSTQGAEGGSRLARKAEDISLLDIYRAMEGGALVQYHYNSPNMSCPVGCNIIPALQGVLCKAQEAFESELSSVSLSSIRDDVISRSASDFPFIKEAMDRIPV